LDVKLKKRETKKGSKREREKCLTEILKSVPRKKEKMGNRQGIARKKSRDLIGDNLSPPAGAIE